MLKQAEFIGPVILQNLPKLILLSSSILLMKSDDWKFTDKNSQILEYPNQTKIIFGDLKRPKDYNGVMCLLSYIFESLRP